MADKTGIQWCDATWNVVTGCDKVSPGCAHCYAETVADRFWATQYPHVNVAIGSPEATNTSTWDRPRIFTDVQCHEYRLDQPLRWKRPRMVFVNSMSDLFHEDVHDSFIDKVFAVMALAPQHTFQVLTKRPDRMQTYLSDFQTPEQWLKATYQFKPGSPALAGVQTTWASNGLANVWLGVSVENQHWADARIPKLLETPAAVRFVSYEPALGPVDFWKFIETDGPSLDWIIVGGESGSDARPFNLRWAEKVIEQGRLSHTPIFMKQLGARVGHWASDDHMGGKWFLHDKKGGDMREWPNNLRVREYPTSKE